MDLTSAIVLGVVYYALYRAGSAAAGSPAEVKHFEPKRDPQVERLAAILIRQGAVVLDTETTGRDPEDCEVVEIAMVDAASGDTIYHSLVQTRDPIPEEATEFHGIDDDAVRWHLTMPAMWPKLQAMIGRRPVVAYNSDFDVEAISASLRRWGAKGASIDATCLMRMYARWRGEPDEFERGERWHSLSDAAAQCGLASAGRTHRALADARLARKLLLYLAKQIPR